MTDINRMYFVALKEGVGVQYHVDSPGIAISQNMVSVSSGGRHSVEILNVNGKLVFSQSRNGAYDYTLSALEPGVYLVKVSTPEVIKTKRILIY